MDNIRFYNSFAFRVFSRNRSHHTDNSAGIDCHFIARMRRGTCKIVTLDGEELHLEAGDVFYLPLGLRYHSYWMPNGANTPTVEWESYRFDFFPCKSGKNYVMQKLHPNTDAMRFWDMIDPSLGVNTSSVGLLYAFLGEVFPTMKQTESDPQKELFSKAKHYIHQNPQFKVPELARHCGMSESGLYAFFRSYANTSPIELKNSIQVQKAVSLLGSTDLSVEEISDRVGFRSVAYFRKILRARTGKTPSEIRHEEFCKYGL
jgi:AraC-like DNA-binding protein